jgi:hypothetical protein
MVDFNKLNWAMPLTPESDDEVETPSPADPVMQPARPTNTPEAFQKLNWANPLGTSEVNPEVPEAAPAEPNVTPEPSAEPKSIPEQPMGPPEPQNDPLSILDPTGALNYRPENSELINDFAKSPAGQTVTNVMKGIPAAEVAANLITSAYGIPLSGLAGALALPFGDQTAGNVIDKVQKMLVYQPQSEGGKQLVEAMGYPMELLHEGAKTAVDKADIKNPYLTAGVHTAIEGLPAIIGGRMALTRRAPAQAAALDIKTLKAINKGINKGVNKGVKPGLGGKGNATQVNRYRQNAKTAVQEIVGRKESLKYIDADGAMSEGHLPKTLDQFSQAIEQVKRSVYEEYDKLTKTADATGKTVNFKDTLNNIRGANV